VSIIINRRFSGRSLATANYLRELNSLLAESMPNFAGDFNRENWFNYRQHAPGTGSIFSTSGSAVTNDRKGAPE